MPWARNSRSSWSSAWESFSLSDEVGSSRISSSTSLDSALAISTSCCLPTPMRLILVSGVSWRPTFLSSSIAFACDLLQLMTPRFACSLREEDVLGDRELRDERQLLVDDDDALVLAVADAVEAALLALVEELAVVRAVRVDARHDLHQGRLAGPVLADQGVDLARADGEA